MPTLIATLGQAANVASRHEGIEHIREHRGMILVGFQARHRDKRTGRHYDCTRLYYVEPNLRSMLDIIKRRWGIQES